MLIIPNATDTTGGNKYAALDQAEPDSLDFEIMGNTGSSGVVSGLTVTSNSSAVNVNVAAGVIALKGSAYAVSASSTYALPAAPADNRFDLIIARVTAGVAALVTISGTNSATNPTFPKSRNVITGTFNAAQHVDLDTDVVIAAIYRTGSGTITTSRILDKRAMLSSGIVLQGTSAPNSGVGTGAGNLYFKSNTAVTEGTASGVYVRLASGDWVGLAKDVGLHVPIGAMVEWPTAAAVPANFAEPLGQGLSTTTYATLFSIYGYEHGGSGSTFLMPNYNGVYKRGTSSTALVGDAFGNDTVTLATNQLPPHTHPNPHSHTYAHTHGIDHGHTATTSPAGAHSHGPGTFTVNGNAGLNPALRVPTYSDVGINPVYITGYIAPGGSVPPTFAGGMVLQHTDAALVTSGLTSPENAHTHPVAVVSHSGSTVSQSASTTPADVTPTGETGGGLPVSLLPASRYVRNIIRVS
jgi:microcystin-dependent protein